MECLILVQRLSTIGDTSSSSTPFGFLFQAVSNLLSLNAYHLLLNDNANLSL